VSEGCVADDFDAPVPGSRMASIKSFEDIEAWQKARVLARSVYEISGQGAFGRDFGLRDQIRRSAVSVVANIAEGFERGGNAEFRQFLSTAKGSVAEVRSHLYVALDAEMISGEQFRELNSLASEIGLMIGGLMKYLGSSDLRGQKYR
jgi:four helix bundle protein